MKQNSVRGSSSWFERTSHHRREEQEQGPWITVNGFVTTVTMNQSQFLDGKLELNKTQVSKVVATKFISKEVN